MEKYAFIYCQKVVVFSSDKQSVLLCQRKGEADYDGIFSFIGGKMEITDSSMLEALRREKNEELGESFKIKIATIYTSNRLFTKQDGRLVVLPHYYAVHVKGEIRLSDEYSAFSWVKLDDLEAFEPKIETIPELVGEMMRLESILNEGDFQII